MCRDDIRPRTRASAPGSHDQHADVVVVAKDVVVFHVCARGARCRALRRLGDVAWQYGRAPILSTWRSVIWLQSTPNSAKKRHVGACARALRSVHVAPAAADEKTNGGRVGLARELLFGSQVDERPT